jgi:hypothetical protein
MVGAAESAPLDRYAAETELVERASQLVVASVGPFPSATVQLHEGGEVLGVRHRASARGRAELHRGLPRDAPEHDVLVLLGAGLRSALSANEHDAVVRPRHAWRQGHFEGPRLGEEVLFLVHSE